MYTIRISTVAPDGYVNAPDMQITAPDLEYVTTTAEWTLNHFFTHEIDANTMLELVERGEITQFTGLYIEFVRTA